MVKPATKSLLKIFMRRLTSLRGNNRSLFLPRLAAHHFIDIHQLSFLNGSPAFSIIEAMMRGEACTLSPLADARMPSVADQSQKLKRLQREANFIFEEKGTHDLHIGWPFVRGKLADGTRVRCALLYFPVELRVEKERWKVVPRPDSDITFNKTFLLAYAHYQGLAVEERLLDETFEEADHDSQMFRVYLYQQLQKSKVDVHFNADTYRDEILAFAPYTHTDFDEQNENGKLKLFQEAVLGIFPQAGSTLVPDYLHLLQADTVADMDDFFAARSTVTTDTIREEKIYNAFPLDAWQELALKKVKAGQSLVVQGPPGTGKSQLIANVIANAVAEGKRVLLVCQKRVALDVVYDRLAEKKLDEFIALVHDFKNDRAAIYSKAARQIDRIDEYKARNNSIDTIQMERAFYQASRRIDQLCEELEQYRQALLYDGECGWSVRQLYLLAEPAEPFLPLQQYYRRFSRDQVPAFLQLLKTFCDLKARQPPPESFWSKRLPFIDTTVAQLSAWQQWVAEVPEVLEQAQANFVAAVGHPLHLETIDSLLENETVLQHFLKSLTHEPHLYAYLQAMAGENEEQTSALWLLNMERVINECFEGEGVELSVATAQLGQFQQALNRSMQARRSLIGLIRWELFSTDKVLIKRALVANGLPGDKIGFRKLEERLDRRLNLEHNLTKLRAKSWLLPWPEPVSATGLQQWFGWQHQAAQLKDIFNQVRGLATYLSPKLFKHEVFVARLREVLHNVARVANYMPGWRNRFTRAQLEQLAHRDGARKAAQELAVHFEAMCALDRTWQQSATPDREVIGLLADHAKAWRNEKLERLFLNSVYHAWIFHAESKHPELSWPSTGELNVRERELRQLLLDKESLSEQILLLRAREGVVERLEFNRLNNRVTYRDLQHQLTKKKKIWPIRKVVAEFDDEMFRLLPCWLASPEAVSALFPMREMFDLVIFDEASQCFAERGVPALYRGKQVCIAGDRHQLQPFDLYQVRWQGEEDEHIDAEVDSLLALGERYLPTVALYGHYRSRWSHLIQFSNRHFYNNKLYLVPDPPPAFPFSPLEWIQVPGVWQNQSNLPEATQVARLVLHYYQHEPHAQVGVITFNATQQALVWDEVERVFGEQNLLPPHHLFVKNIENVQGDERDIIIFSIGYGPDPKGKLQLQFGSLSQAGGENRLNVAITRARHKVVVVASVDPAQWKMDGTTHRGPKLLKEYLAFVKQPVAAEPDATSTRSGLAKKLFELAAEVAREVPFADGLVLGHDGQPLLLFTDGDHYEQALTMKAVHSDLPQLLEKKGWRFQRVFSRQWWRDRETLERMFGGLKKPKDALTR